MQIIEVKNNLVRISYNSNQNNLVLSGFVLIKEQNQSFIAQVMHLEANTKGNFAILKLLFIFDENGFITNYNGSIPSPKSDIELIESQEIVNLLYGTDPLFIGKLAQQEVKLSLDKSIFKENLLACCEKEEERKILAENITKELISKGENVLLIDLEGNKFEGESDCNKISAGGNFKLPLNYETINFIYEKGLEEARLESKALIQEVLLDVQNYVKTIPDGFIPFNSFKNVVDEQYQELKLVDLVLLKNKLLKFFEAGVFAQEKKEFNVLKNSLSQNRLTTLDLSRLDNEIQREVIAYTYKILKDCQKPIYVIMELKTSVADKKLLKQIFTAKNIYSSIICPYSFNYLTELKQIAKNLILFQPIQQQQDFASYGTFLNKLNPEEFIIYGKTTQNIPLIVKLEKTAPLRLEKTLDEEIKEDVDKIYTVSNSEIELAQTEENDLTEDDLDFIETLNEDKTTQQEDTFLMDETTQEPELNLDFEIHEKVPASEEIDFENEIKEPQKEISEIALEEEKILPIEPQVAMEPSLNEPEKTLDILTAKEASLPIYSAQVLPKEGLERISFEQGDAVMHAKYGKGVIEKMISYGSKTLCSIQFDNVGRRLLDPTLAELKKI